MKATRAEVYAAIDSETAYSDAKWKEADAGRSHEISSWLTYMRHQLNEAERIAATTYPETGALDPIRKLLNLGVKCLEEHGAPGRDGF
jgi:hypothetical protein